MRVLLLRCQAPLRAGFTLVEVAVTVALLVLVAGTVSFSLRGNLQASRTELAFAQLRLVDRASRVLAERTRRHVELQFDVVGKRLVRIGADQQGAVVESDLAMSEVLSSGSGGGRKRSPQGAQTTIEFRTDGSSPSYAVCLPVGRDQTEWIVFAGFTGQSLRTTDVQEVEQLLGGR